MGVSKEKRLKAAYGSSGLKRGPSARRIPTAACRDVEERLLDRRLTFRFDCLDLAPDCPWSLASIAPSDLADLLSKLREFENITVGEIRRKDSQAFKEYPDFARCPNREAQRRLAACYEMQGDSVARLRLGGRKRLYGFLVEHEFHLLWWDPNHEVWPSEPRHT